MQKQEHDCHRHVPPFRGCLNPTFVRNAHPAHFSAIYFSSDRAILRHGTSGCVQAHISSLQGSQTFAISSCFPNYAILQAFFSFQTHWIIILSTRGLALPTSLPRALWGSITTW